jgi:hypothetical protein
MRVRGRLLFLGSAATSLALIALVVLVGPSIASGEPSIVSGGPSIAGEPQATTPPTDSFLRFANFQTSRVLVTASCAGAGCIAITPLFTPASLSLQCPQTAGHTCTYYLNVVAQVVTASHLDNNVFVFLIDGAAPSPGPTDRGGAVTVAIPNCGTAPACDAGTRSFAVAGTVTNTFNNQPHTVKVSIGCKDVTGSDGCRMQTGFANLEIITNTP